MGTIYDRTFHKSDGYNNKLHRCDRAHTKHQKLDIHSEVSKTYFFSVCHNIKFTKVVNDQVVIKNM